METEHENNQPAVSMKDELQAVTRLHEIGLQLLEARNLTSLLDDIATVALEITSAVACSLELADRQTGELKVLATKELPGAAQGNRAQGAGAVPMRKIPYANRTGDTRVVLTIYGRASSNFTERDMKRAEELAMLTAGVLERIGVEEVFINNKKNTEILYEVVGMLLENDPVQDIIEQLCNKVMQFLGCDIFFNYLISKEYASTMHLNAYGGIPAEQAQEVNTLRFGQAVCGLAAYQGERIIVKDMQSIDDERVALLKAMGLRTYVCHPLFGSDGIIGTLSFGSRRKDSFDDGELALMHAVSNHVAVAVNRLKTENDLRAIADEIKEKSKLVTDYFTNLSHEFKTPLSIILVDLQLMEYRLRNAGSDAREQLGKMVDVMRQNALRLLRLIGNLLDVTKIDAGYMTVKLTDKDIVELIAGIVDSVRNYADNANITLTFKGGRKRRMMPLDSEKLERIVLNLLSNAIKHTAEGGHIVVTLKHEDCCVTLSVQDNGEGIPDEDKAFIFDRFRQVNASLTRVSEGCGIGLSLTKALVELLGGRIWFDSQYGHGSKFYINLPVHKIGTPMQYPEAESMTRDRKVEMEFSDIRKPGNLH